MNTAYRSLWSIAVSHAFRGGICDDLAFVIPKSTSETLAGLQALVRERTGTLHVLIPSDPVSHPPGDWAGRRLIFGLAPRDPWFTQYTAPAAINAGEVPLFSNEVAADTLGAVPRGVELAGSRPNIAPRLDTRPLTATVTTPAGGTLNTTRLSTSDATWQFLQSQPGEVAVNEVAANGQTATRRLFIEPSLATAPVWGLLCLTATANHAANGCRFTLPLAARSDRLQYVVVVKPTSNSDLNSIQLHDTGAATDQRNVVTFTRTVLAPNDSRRTRFLLDPGDTRKVILFESQSQVARRDRGPHGFELHRGGEVLISNLPQPGAERSDAQFVIHLSKP